MTSRLTIPLVLGAALLLLGLLFLGQCQKARSARAEASLSAETAKAVSESGKDAIGAVGAVSGRNSDSDAITRENSDAILHAPGADAPVPAGLAGAARDGLCRRAAYRCSAECLRRAAAAGVAGAGAGCRDAGK